MEGASQKKEKSFAFHWGSGVVAEEAQAETPYDRPTIQLLKYTEGEAAAGAAIRFCHYSHEGRFRRSPLMLSEDALDDMRRALDDTPELRALLRRLLEEPD